jgi:hypothetical protein
VNSGAPPCEAILGKDDLIFVRDESNRKAISVSFVENVLLRAPKIEFALPIVTVF